jgi:hypothetical protein
MPKFNRLVVAAVAAALLAAAPAGAHAAAPKTPPWERALRAQSEALNRAYPLGRYAIPAAAGAKRTPDWLRALEIRSAAENKRAGLGRYAAAAPASDAFSWRDAGLGAAFTAALCLLLVAVAVVARGRTQLSRPS